MKAKHVLTGSVETEQQIHKLLGLIQKVSDPAPLSAWDGDEYWLDVMVNGRCGPGQRYEGSSAKDDTGGFFEVRDGRVYLTEKALGCISGLQDAASANPS